MINGIIGSGILKGRTKLSYVGYSEGTTQMLSALAYNYGQLQDKLNLFVALGPLADNYYATNKFYVSVKNACNYIREFSMNVQHIFSVGGSSWLQDKLPFCTGLGAYKFSICGFIEK